MGVRIEVMKLELEKLRDEVAELKRCQLDYVKLCAVLFGVTASALGGLYGIVPLLSPRAESADSIVIALYAGILSIDLAPISWTRS